MKLGILGGGQLGMMMCQAAKNIDIQTIIFSDSEDSPAIKFSDNYHIAPYDDFSKLDLFINESDIITYEFENIPFKTLEYINKKLPVHPSPSINFIIQDRFTEKEFINKLNISTVPYIKVNEKEDILKTSEDFFPAILKTRKMGYDGKGQLIINNKNEIPNIDFNDFILEKKINLKKEISVITVRYQNGNSFSYSPIDNIHQNQILYKSTSPALLDDIMEQKALGWSKKIISALDYIGVICIEFFIDNNEDLYVNEIAPRVHNSGHLTIESYNVSQFESHIRSVCNLNEMIPKMQKRSEMYNVLGEDIISFRKKDEKLNTHFHDYFKQEAKKGRKMGHVTKILD